MGTRTKGRSPAEPPRYFNWLENLDKTIGELPSQANWLDDSNVAAQRCRLFIMQRYPGVVRLFPDEVLLAELSRGLRLLRRSELSPRILNRLNGPQLLQLAGLFLDVRQAVQDREGHQRSAKDLRKLAGEADRRIRNLSRKVLTIRRELDDLQVLADSLHPLLGLEYSRAAKRCLKVLKRLEEDPSTAGETYRSLKSEYPVLEDPLQLGMVEFYWFFRHECRCSGHESEVRVAMIVNDFLISDGASKLSYKPTYTTGETQGCSAVRLAVQRYHPRTDH